MSLYGEDERENRPKSSGGGGGDGAGPRRFWKTIAGPDATPYPEDGQDPPVNCYYVQWQKNPKYTESPGHQDLETEDTDPPAFGYILNLEEQKFIEEGSRGIAFLENGQYFTIDKVLTQTMIVVTLGQTETGGSVAALKGDFTVRWTKQWDPLQQSLFETNFIWPSDPCIDAKLAVYVPYNRIVFNPIGAIIEAGSYATDYGNRGVIKFSKDGDELWRTKLATTPAQVSTGISNAVQDTLGNIWVVRMHELISGSDAGDKLIFKLNATTGAVIDSWNRSEAGFGDATSPLMTNSLTNGGPAPIVYTSNALWWIRLDFHDFEYHLMQFSTVAESVTDHGALWATTDVFEGVADLAVDGTELLVGLVHTYSTTNQHVATTTADYAVARRIDPSGPSATDFQTTEIWPAATVNPVPGVNRVVTAHLQSGENTIWAGHPMENADGTKVSVVSTGANNWTFAPTQNTHQLTNARILQKSGDTLVLSYETDLSDLPAITHSAPQLTQLRKSDGSIVRQAFVGTRIFQTGGSLWRHGLAVRNQ